MAKTRKGSRKASTSRAKGTRKAAKGTKKSASSRSTTSSQRKQIAPSLLDLKKLRSDIVKANDALQKRLQVIDPESEQGKKIAGTQSTIARWSFEIDSMCGTSSSDEPCGTTMVIS